MSYVKNVVVRPDMIENRGTTSPQSIVYRFYGLDDAKTDIIKVRINKAVSPTLTLVLNIDESKEWGKWLTTRAFHIEYTVEWANGDSKTGLIRKFETLQNRNGSIGSSTVQSCGLPIADVLNNKIQVETNKPYRIIGDIDTEHVVTIKQNDKVGTDLSTAGGVLLEVKDKYKTEELTLLKVLRLPEDNTMITRTSAVETRKEHGVFSLKINHNVKIKSVILHYTVNGIEHTYSLTGHHRDGSYIYYTMPILTYEGISADAYVEVVENDTRHRVLRYDIKLIDCVMGEIPLDITFVGNGELGIKGAVINNILTTIKDSLIGPQTFTSISGANINQQAISPLSNSTLDKLYDDNKRPFNKEFMHNDGRLVLTTSDNTTTHVYNPFTASDIVYDYPEGYLPLEADVKTDGLLILTEYKTGEDPDLTTINLVATDIHDNIRKLEISDRRATHMPSMVISGCRDKVYVLHDNELWFVNTVTMVKSFILKLPFSHGNFVFEYDISEVYFSDGPREYITHMADFGDGRLLITALYDEGTTLFLIDTDNKVIDRKIDLDYHMTDLSYGCCELIFRKVGTTEYYNLK